MFNNIRILKANCYVYNTSKGCSGTLALHNIHNENGDIRFLGKIKQVLKTCHIHIKDIAVFQIKDL